MRAILLCFGAVSGIKVNFFKVELIAMRVESQLLSHLMDILGCKVGSLPATSWDCPIVWVKLSKALRMMRWKEWRRNWRLGRQDQVDLSRLEFWRILCKFSCSWDLPSNYPH